jgi:hypothetical protein
VPAPDVPRVYRADDGSRPSEANVHAAGE